MAERAATNRHRESVDPLGELETLLFALDPGQVKALVGANLEQVRHWLDGRELEDLEKPVLLFDRVTNLHSVDILLDLYIATLADAAFRLWPVWYSDVDFSCFDGSSIGLHGMHAVIQRVAEQHDNISALWARRASSRVLNGAAPILSSFSAAEQLRQLSLAIHRHGLTFIIELADLTASPERLRAFANSAAWLARHGSLSVVVLLPTVLAQNGGLDALLYDAAYLPLRDRAPAPAGPPTHPATEKESAKWLWPLIGRPHPFSPAEQLLAATLARHADLGRLFAFNQPVEATAGTHYVADLLWREGRVIVEIDGYRFHSDEAAFARDRHRDYELTLSGYVILRLPHDEVMADVTAAVNKISNVVQFSRDSQRLRN